ncbi:unnamed protein product [Ceutorhynchus assimilis]|uniref:Uncharacterized protein n=1 Tax=Ceutorhynchus assimilis TaxID=467358 RepID=A0A9N9MRX3_9CUCU|nr:unnamed protein product [Ceutorhynchus assimilis]
MASKAYDENNPTSLPNTTCFTQETIVEDTSLDEISDDFTPTSEKNVFFTQKKCSDSTEPTGFSSDCQNSTLSYDGIKNGVVNKSCVTQNAIAQTSLAIESEEGSEGPLFSLAQALDFERSPAAQTLPDIIENDENVSGNYSQKTLHIDANSSEPQNEIPHPLPNTDTTEQHQEPTKENAEEPGSYEPKPGCSAEKPSSEYSVSYDDERPTILRLTKRNYYVSPLHSDESDIDDSDADPNFTVDSSPEARRSSHDTDKENIQSDESVSAEPDNTNKGKKRKLNAQEWGVKKTKLLRNSGKAYTSCSKSKKKFPERKLRPACTEKCRLGCSAKISEAVRENIFRTYWALADLEKQREFISSHTGDIKPKYRYSSTQNFRRMNTAFYFDVNSNRIRVCKKFFKATLDINDRPIRTTVMKKSDTGFLFQDRRGKHGKQPVVAPEIKDSVRRFISAIPRIESHYLRAQTTREYIEGGKSSADLYRDYKEERERHHLPIANSVMFNRIFNGEFNISFYAPKKDQCDQCESYKNSNQEGKAKLVDSYNLHLEEKKLSREQKSIDKNIADNNTHVNEGDNVHSVIEKQIRRHLKSGPIYVPEQYATLIRTAKKNGPPYRVHELTFEDFFDLKILQEELGSNFNMNTDKAKSRMLSTRVFQIFFCLLLVHVLSANAGTAIGRTLANMLNRIQTLLLQVPIISALAPAINPMLGLVKRVFSIL